MILRKISNEEVQAITTLFQYAENIGSEAYTEENVRELIATVWENTPPVRAKDAGIGWMIDFMKKMSTYAEDMFRIGFEDYAAYKEQKKVPTIQELPTDDIFDILANKNMDDDAGELLDELEIRFRKYF